jgi:hypothetical protein
LWSQRRGKNFHTFFIGVVDPDLSNPEQDPKQDLVVLLKPDPAKVS